MNLEKTPRIGDEGVVSDKPIRLMRGSKGVVRDKSG